MNYAFSIFMYSSMNCKSNYLCYNMFRSAVVDNYHNAVKICQFANNCNLILSLTLTLHCQKFKMFYYILIVLLRCYYQVRLR